MIKEGQVVGLVTTLAEPYARATPAASVQLFLEGYGIKPSETSQPKVPDTPPQKPPSPTAKSKY
jgi:hypothetical protein